MRDSRQKGTKLTSNGGVVDNDDDVDVVELDKIDMDDPTEETEPALMPELVNDPHDSQHPL